MSTELILIAILGLAVGAYFVFFNKPKKIAYSQDKIKEIIKTSRRLLSPDEGDHEAIKVRKVRMLEELNEIESYIIRTPSEFTQEEIVEIDNILPKVKEIFKSGCKAISELIPLIENQIYQAKKIVSSAQDVLNTYGKDDNAEEDEDARDLMEKLLETSPVLIKKHEADLKIIQMNLEKYQNI